MELKLTNDNFDTEVLDASVSVLVDFWASWCGPCMMLSPIISEIASEREGSLKVGKVNVDEEPALAARYGIMSIPTLLLFRDGKLVSQRTGYMPKADLLNWLS